MSSLLPVFFLLGSSARSSSTAAFTENDSSFVSTSNILNIDAEASCTLNYVIDSASINVKFFQNQLFCSSLKRYLSKTCNVGSEIQQQIVEEEVGIHIQLKGVKQYIKTARDVLERLFEAVQTKVYNAENTDAKVRILFIPVVYWSKRIYSDFAINVIQKVMDDQKIFTIWEKTQMLSGYYVVYYFKIEPFRISEQDLTKILLNKIIYIEKIDIPDEITINFIKEIENFIFKTKQQQQDLQALDVIYCKYSFQMKMKISLFGQQQTAKITKKHLECLINKHRIKSFKIEMNSTQYNYLIDNCLQKLKDIETQYKDDNVKLRIRENTYHAPQYLIETIKQLITKLISYTVTFTVENIIEHNLTLADKEKSQLEYIAQKHNCKIVKIEIKTKRKICTIPKALTTSTIPSTSKLIIEQSNTFCSSFSMRKASVLNGSIEIHKARNFKSLMVDVGVISIDADARKEGLEFSSGDVFDETNSGEKILFIRWLKSSPEDNQQTVKKSIQTFLSTTLQTVTALYPNIETIAFSTHEWEKYGKQLAEEIIHEIKRQLEIRQSCWTILFVFDCFNNDEQETLYNQFSQILLQIQTDQDGYAQFSCPISSKQSK
ncbi:unnamed protein product [Didymodactylos carnosus]|uniref:Macro domain-containing protein n=1 Tax=Didymodactylos carnosus TaxID=1234261 RepID=A0A815GRA1_9BILA|nr:unnamed protein product [Didymodactylos carnosus]CAF4204611.1 unnamed protein product [Didymodactylos carnosus]